MRPISRNDFAIAIICTLPLEAEAVEALFDETYDRFGRYYGKQLGDANSYINGRIRNHNVVLCCVPRTEKGAASIASSLRVSYTGIELVLIVGICGGAPSTPNNREVYLGDVVIGDAVLNYTFGQRYPGGLPQKAGVKYTLGRPSQEIRTLLDGLSGDNACKEFQNQIQQYVHTLQQASKKWHHPQINDALFKASYLHKHYGNASSTGCCCLENDSPDNICEAALKKDCDDLGCDKSQVIRCREPLEAAKVSVHIGAVASTDTVVKSGRNRDAIASTEEVIAFETEGARIRDDVPCLIIKGICDYADSHRSISWQAYAAVTGASAAKAFLEYWGPRNEGERRKEAEELWVQLMETRKRLLGPKHPDTLASMAGLASTYQSQGRWREAEWLEVQVMETRKQVLGSWHPDTLTSMANLASTYWNQGRWKEAEALEVQVMETRKQVLGSWHPDTLTSKANLALTYQYQGRWKEAEWLEVQVMETRQQVLGPEHPNTLTSMANLALTYRNQGQLKEAERLGVQVMETSKQVLGSDHDDTLASMANLASTYWSQGKWKEAEALFIRVLNTQKQVLGLEHPDTLASMADLASTYQNQGQWKEAEELFIQAMEIQTTVLGSEHPDTLISTANLASTYRSQGRLKQAERLGVQVMETSKQVLGPDHPYTLTSMANLASTYWSQGKWKEAEALFIRVLNTQKQVLGLEHPDTLASMADLASTYQNQGQWKTAEQLFIQVMESQKLVLGPEHTNTLTTMANLASVLLRQGQWRQAEELHLRVVETRKKGLGEVDPPTLNSMVDLASIYKHQGRLAEAKELERQIEDARIWQLEQDSDTDSETSIISSIMSEAYSHDSTTSSGSLYETQRAVPERVARALFEEMELQAYYRRAIEKFGKAHFTRNHDHILRRLFKDLRLEAKNPHHRRALRFANWLSLNRVTELICELCDPNPDLQQLRTTQLLLTQKEDRQFILNRHLRSLANKLDNTSISELHDPGMTVTEAVVMPDFETKKDSKHHGDDRERREDGEDEEDEEDEGDVDQARMLQQLDMEYLMGGKPFRSYKDSVRHLSHTPNTMKEAIESQNIDNIRRLLRKGSDLAVMDEYAWIEELYKLGYSVDDIAELLIENAKDSPWINFEPNSYEEAEPQHGLHLRDCAHQFSFNRPLSQGQLLTTETVSRTEIVQEIQELCGLAGITPGSPELRSRTGSVKFEEQNSVAIISYAVNENDHDLDGNSIISRLYRIIERLSSAAGRVQSAGLCCDCFTIIRFPEDQPNPQLSSVNQVEMCCMEFELIVQMKTELRRLLSVECIEMTDVAGIRAVTERILELLTQTARNIPVDTVDCVFNYCCLAIQFLSLGFLSYFQAHMGPIQFFFLDTLQTTYVLSGNEVSPSRYHEIIASLTNLTCMGEMIQSPVFTFRIRSAETKDSVEKTGPKHDLLASIEDILDTWGPGQVIARRLDNLPYAIRLGGGFITYDGRKYHWSQDVAAEQWSPIKWERRHKVVIGAVVTVNGLCTIDENQYWAKSSTILEPLGTYPTWWELNQRQSGFQAGNYVLYQINGVWCKMHGRTLKQSKLEQDDEMLIPFLDDLWGLQVSFCTSVARRVALREMVADLLPTFATATYTNEQQELWEDLKMNYNIVDSFKGGNLKDWFRLLTPQLYQYTLGILRKMFNVLQHTGIDREGRYLLVSWPHEHDLLRGFKIPCEKQSSWARILADSDDCATFAYISSKCLETETIKCSGPLRNWTNTTLLLETAVIFHNLKEPSFELENDEIFFFKKLDSLLYVRVHRRNETSAASLLTPSTSIASIPWSLQQRLFMREKQRRKRRLREKQATYDIGETVVVLAAKGLL